MSALRSFSRLSAFLVLLILSACTFSPQAPSGYRQPAGATTGDLPVFENRLETEHFILRWTNRSSRTGDNIADPAIIEQTASYLETAWVKMTGLFGRAPYVSPNSGKIEVVFHELDCFGLADPPEGPIQFDSRSWTRNCGIRQPTSAHELFHKLQYAYGYKTRWIPKQPYPWFTEGTAAWAEVFVWGRVSRSCKVDELFKDKNLDFYDAQDMALPFWIFFVSGNRGTPNNQLMVSLFERYEQTGDARESVEEVIAGAYGPPGAFYSLFAKERKHGFWEQTVKVRDNPYSCILGPDGADIVEKLKGGKSGKSS